MEEGDDEVMKKLKDQVVSVLRRKQAKASRAAGALLSLLALFQIYAANFSVYNQSDN